jgi:hypothetical protein
VIFACYIQHNNGPLQDKVDGYWHLEAKIINIFAFDSKNAVFVGGKSVDVHQGAPFRGCRGVAGENTVDKK